MTPITVTLTGTTPLLCGRPATEQNLDGQAPRAQAAARLYLDQAGQPVLPGLNILRCICGAERGRKSSVAQVMPHLGVQEREVRILSPRPWVVDTRSVRLPQTGERGLCHRPRFDDWRLVFTLLVETGALEEAGIHQMVHLAGRRIGIGDYRPERGGPFGRFDVAGWEVR